MTKKILTSLVIGIIVSLIMNVPDAKTGELIHPNLVGAEHRIYLYPSGYYTVQLSNYFMLQPSNTGVPKTQTSQPADTLRAPFRIIQADNVTHIEFYPKAKFKTVSINDFPILKLPLEIIGANPPGEIAFKIKSNVTGSGGTAFTKTFDILRQNDTLTLDFSLVPEVNRALGGQIKKIEAFRIQNPDPGRPRGINLDNPEIKFRFDTPFFLSAPPDSSGIK